MRQRPARALATEPAAEMRSRRRSTSILFFILLMVAMGAALMWVGPADDASAAEVACPNEAFRQGAGAHLADCRAYEQVSPPDKNGSDLERRALVSEDGQRAIFNSRGSFADSPFGGGGGAPQIYYFSHRSNDAWRTSPGSPRPTNTAADMQMFAAAPDLRMTLLRSLGGAFVPDPQPAMGSSGYYLWDNIARAADQLFTIPEYDSRQMATSRDLSHVAFSSVEVLTADEGVPDAFSGPKVYEAAGGSIRLVSRRPVTDEPFVEPTIVAGTSVLGGMGSLPGLRGAVSRNGAHIFFTTDGGTGAVYRRSNGTTTELGSPSRRFEPDPSGPAQKVFELAAPRGNRVLFTSRELLTDDANTGPARAGNDLYRFDFDSNQLVDVSATPGGDGASVTAVIGASDDGDRIYYVATGEVTTDVNPVGATPVAGSPNVFMWEDDGTPSGTTRFVTTLDPADSGNWNWDIASKKSRVTADGRYLLLRSEAPLTSAPNAGTAQLYRYDVEDVGGDALRCVSCRPDGSPSSGSAEIPPYAAQDIPSIEVPALSQVPLARVMTEDGRVVVFESDDALVPKDTNGATDVYAWSDGEVRLISTGSSGSPSMLAGTTVGGADVFFLTREQLVPQDVDSHQDLYTARVNGGLASQQSPPSPDCVGEECQGPAVAGPSIDGPASSSFDGPGNVRAERDCAPLQRSARRARARSRHLGRQARRASGRRAVRLRRTHGKAKRRAKRAVTRAQRCERGVR